MEIKDLLNMDGGEAVEWLIQNQHDYELFPLELDNCKHCGSGDVGASNNTAYCYKCQHEVNGESTSKAILKWNGL